jgi:hypothetical protein
LLEDAIDLATWMIDAEEIPPFVKWSPEAGARAQADAIRSMGEDFL